MVLGETNCRARVIPQDPGPMLSPKEQKEDPIWARSRSPSLAQSMKGIHRPHGGKMFKYKL